MSLPAIVWIIVGTAVGLVWLARWMILTSVGRVDPPLRADTGSQPPEPAPKLTVLVAAKDEARHIRACITSILDQDYPGLEVIAVNDRSRDDTSKILHELERGAAGKLRVLDIDTLPAGWFGKHHAMHRAARISRGAWLLLTDADCVFTSRRALSVAMREAVENQVDLLSLTPVMVIERVWERVILPVCAAILMVWFQPRRVNDPNRRTAYANGAFMLIRRTCYEAVGGHERARDRINEDMQIARNVKRAGFRLRVRRNDGLYTARMHATPVESWRGWARILFGALETRTRIAVAGALIVVFTLMPWVSLGVSVASARTSAPGSAAWPIAGFWLVVCGVQLASLSQWYRLMRLGRAWCLAYPVGAVIALGILANALFKVGGWAPTIWRGTRYRFPDPPGGPGNSPGNSPGDRPGDPLDDRPGDPLDDQVGDQPGDRLDDQVGDQPGDSLDDQVGDRAGDRLDDQVGDRPGDSLNDPPGDSLADPLGAPLGTIVPRSRFEEPVTDA